MIPAIVIGLAIVSGSIAFEIRKRRITSKLAPPAVEPLFTRVAQRAGIRPLYFYGVSTLCVLALSFAFYRDHEARIAANGPQPSVGLYWIENVDPTLSPGVAAPQWQLLIRTDTPALYYKSGTANTAWTKIGSGAASGGITGSGTATHVPVWLTSTSQGDSSAIDTGSVFSIGEPFVMTSQVRAPGTITPPDFTGANVNNYNPAGLATAYVIEQACTGSGDTFISGLQAQPTGTIIVFKNTGYFNLNFLNHNSGSLAANQFDLPSATSWQLEPGYSLVLRYTGTQWEAIGGFVDSYYSMTVGTLLNVGQIRYQTPQAYTTTGTSTDVLLNSSTTVFQYIGAGDATITGFAGTAGGRLMIVRNESGHNLTLPNLAPPGSSINQLNNGGVDIVLTGSNSNAVYIWDTINTNWGLISYSSQVVPNLSVGNTALPSGGTLQVKSEATNQHGLDLTNSGGTRTMDFYYNGIALAVRDQTFSFDYMSFQPGTGFVQTTQGYQASGSAPIEVSGTGQLIFNGGAAALACNGTGGVTCASATCNDNAGTLVTNTGATSCTVTFVGSPTNAPSCTVGVQDGTIVGHVASETSSVLTIALSASASAKNVDYVCGFH